MDLDKWMSRILNLDILTELEVVQLCEKAKEIFFEEANIVNIEAPVNICGNIHGQFFDLLELFRIGGQIPDKKYIFLGDFIDCGVHQVLTIQYLLCLKIKYPNNIILIRGNHESKEMSIIYGNNIFLFIFVKFLYLQDLKVKLLKYMEIIILGVNFVIYLIISHWLAQQIQLFYVFIVVYLLNCKRQINLKHFLECKTFLMKDLQLIQFEVNLKKQQLGNLV